MLKNNKGFTLIELLVAVLIIGILAAIALPMYNVAVERSRVIGEMTTLKTFHNAVLHFYPQDNDFPSALRIMHIGLSEDDWTYNGMTVSRNNGCTITLEGTGTDITGNENMSMVCPGGWRMDFRFAFSGGTIMSGQKTFEITDNNRQALLSRVARAIGWQQVGSTNLYIIP